METKTIDSPFDIAISDFNSAGIRKFAEAGGAQYMRQVASQGRNDSRAVLYHLDNDSFAIDTNGDPALFADEGDLMSQLREWATERNHDAPLDDESGQTDIYEHLMWLVFAPMSEVDTWVADLAK